ncbi:ammonium transporter [Salininema proteolyticum]|uniref:Ammonium transporter n=1 Tax=Salininema proteolyticum TaxID=1607685 RepID=A0ABV8TYT0_9ACTN
MNSIDTGSNAWILISAALVLLMTPGLALFYGGLTRATSVVNMMMKCLAAMGIVTVAWTLVGSSMSAGEGGSLFGSLTSDFGLRTVMGLGADEAGVSDGAMTSFSMMFAIITVALIAGAVADRMKFGAWILFTAVWSVLVYFPVAYWVWGGGFLHQWGVLDFAGGAAVHVNAGAAALALALVVGRRIGWREKDSDFAPHNLPMVMLGTGLLWFGWFGFNAGSAFASDAIAGLAMTTTQVATAGAVLAWLAVDRLRGVKPSIIGGCSGVIAGLVAITPAAGFVSPLGALAIGAVAGAVCPLAVGLKERFGYDDSLDVVGLHMVAGLWGSIAVGLFAVESTAAGENGLFYGGGWGLLGVQTGGTLAVAAYSFIVAALIGLALKYTVGIRVGADEEKAGIDSAEHGETSYVLPVGAPEPELSLADGQKPGEAAEREPAKV